MPMSVPDLALDDDDDELRKKYRKEADTHSNKIILSVYKVVLLKESMVMLP